VSTAAAFCSVLFEQPPGQGRARRPPIFGDLSVGQVLTSVAAGWADYGLTRFPNLSCNVRRVRNRQSPVGSGSGMRRSAGSSKRPEAVGCDRIKRRGEYRERGSR
jgi:hypothetical protein